MNPATAVHSMPRPMVNDISVPAPRPAPAPSAPAQPLQLQAQPQHTSLPAAQPQVVPAAPAQPAPVFAANLVTNLQVHNPGQSGSVNEDAELEKIMKDVGHELNKDDHTKNKKHFSIFSHKAKPGPAVAIKPTAQPPAAPLAVPAVSSQSASVPQPVGSSHPVKPTAAVKPKPVSTAPVMVIMMTVLVTGLLMAAAVYTYK